MTYCRECDREFRNWNGYHQHMDNSAVHNQDQQWDCDYRFCDRSFYSEYALDQHCANSPSHPWCVECKRLFQSESNLNAHLRSRIHLAASINCPFCKAAFTTASGLTIHLESGSCSSGVNRHKINELVQKLDRNNVITRPMLTMPSYSNTDTYATDRAWNGYAFECCLCTRDFGSLNALNSHLRSPAHDQNIYRCPGPCCGRTYKLLSGLVQHVESESCGVMRFAQVQSQARNGIQNMVGRMISG